MIMYHLGPQLGVWIMQVSTFSSVLINRLHCIDNIRLAPFITSRYFDIHGSQYHDAILNQCIILPYQYVLQVHSVHTYIMCVHTCIYATAFVKNHFTSK